MNNILVDSTNKSILSNKFLNFDRDNKNNLPLCINSKEHEELSIFKNFSYPVSSWPVIMDNEMSKELSELSVTIPKLIQQIPQLYFNSDIKKIANYYFGGNEIVAHFALMSHEKNVETSCRLDLIYSEKGFEIIEVNIGSSIGGYQMQIFEPVVRKSHPEILNDKNADTYYFSDSLTNYICFLVNESIKKIPKNQKVLNLFMGMNMALSENDEARKNEIHFFNSFYQKELKKRGLTGKVFGGGASEMSMSGKQLVFDGNNIHAVIIVEPDGKEIPRNLMRAFMMDRIYFPDHLALNIYEDKRNLGLLRELAQQQKFDHKDNELILKSIPETFEVKDENILYNGQLISLIILLRDKKDDFVIKPARGFQGVDVFVGKYSSPEVWENAIQYALKEEIFIAQKFSDSLDFDAPNKDNQWIPHKLVWGSFGFGGNYGGVMVRMTEKGENDGVINSATGAILAVVFETT